MKALEIAKELETTKGMVLSAAKSLGFDAKNEHVTVISRGAWDFDQFALSAIADRLGKTDKIAAAPAKAEAKANDPNELALDIMRGELERAHEREQAARDEKASELAAKDRQIEELQRQLRDANERLAKANDKITALQNRSWIDRLLGRGLPAPTP